MGFNQECSGKEIIQMLYDCGMIETWYRDNPDGFILKAKIWSPFYINIRPCGSKSESKEILLKIGTALGGLIKEKIPDVSRVVGLYIAGMPIATAITIASGIPSCYGRHFEDVDTVDEFNEKLPNIKCKLLSHGHHCLVEGDLKNGDKVAIIDDLATKFNTKLIARAQINEAAKDKGVCVSCNDVVVLIDREQGAKETALANDMRLWSLIPLRSEGIHWLKDRMESLEYETIVDYLKDDIKYQNPRIQQRLKELAKKR